jgi:hypothetical protein
MAQSLEDVLSAFTPAQRAPVEARAQELIEEELTLTRGTAGGGTKKPVVIDHGVEHAGRDSCRVIQRRSGTLPLNRHVTASTSIANVG